MFDAKEYAHGIAVTMAKGVQEMPEEYHASAHRFIEGFLHSCMMVIVVMGGLDETVMAKTITQALDELHPDWPQEQKTKLFSICKSCLEEAPIH